MSRFKIVNNKKIPLTAEENKIEDQREATHEAGKLDRKLHHLRVKRNNLLEQTDWWGTSDNTMTDEQKKYRKDLRDITNGLTTVEEVEAVEFPTKP
jgi:hypothetical protein